jgi:CRISPR-associated protein Cmr3
MATLIIEPVDVLMLRGNRLFGGAVHGGAQMPPWPSVIAGAVASRALADAGEVTKLCMESRLRDPEEILHQTLGPDYGLRELLLMQGEKVWCPMPADLVVTEDPVEGLSVHRLEPRKVAGGVKNSYPLPMWPVLNARERRKPARSPWLSLDGLRAHLRGETPSGAQVTTPEQLWAVDPRLGIELDGRTRTVVTGAIYTTDAVAPKEGVSLLARLEGNNLPLDGLLRLGGDGRAARVRPADEKIVRELEMAGKPESAWSGFRMILATPGIFPLGWIPPGVDSDFVMSFEGLTARLVAAAVSRHEVVSGWDLAKGRPKPAQKVVAAGSCYWFQVEKGDAAVLERLRGEGLWALMEKDDPTMRRRHEGWNQVWFGNWPI